MENLNMKVVVAVGGVAGAFAGGLKAELFVEVVAGIALLGLVGIFVCLLEVVKVFKDFRTGMEAMKGDLLEALYKVEDRSDKCGNKLEV